MKTRHLKPNSSNIIRILLNELGDGAVFAGHWPLIIRAANNMQFLNSSDRYTTAEYLRALHLVTIGALEHWGRQVFLSRWKHGLCKMWLKGKCTPEVVAAIVVKSLMETAGSGEDAAPSVQVESVPPDAPRCAREIWMHSPVIARIEKKAAQARKPFDAFIEELCVRFIAEDEPDILTVPETGKVVSFYTGQPLTEAGA